MVGVVAVMKTCVTVSCVCMTILICFQSDFLRPLVLAVISLLHPLNPPLIYLLPIALMTFKVACAVVDIYT